VIDQGLHRPEAKKAERRLQEARSSGMEISSDKAPDEDLDCVIFI
jgi:hypothetical protein